MNGFPIDAKDIEVLESFEFEEEVQRLDTYKYYPLSQQLDDFEQSMLPAGDNVSSHVLIRANKKRRLAEALYRETTTWGDDGVPIPKPFGRLPLESLESLPDWIVPVVDGMEIIRDRDMESTVVKVIQTKLPMVSELSKLTGDQRVKQEFAKQQILTHSESDVNVYGSGKVVYRGYSIRGKELQPLAKTTNLLPRFVSQRSLHYANGTSQMIQTVQYPEESMPITGWVILNPREGNLRPEAAAAVVDGKVPDIITDPASSQMWFQSKPVLLTQYRDLVANRPRLEEIVQLDDASDQLHYWGLSQKDIPFSLYDRMFPAHKELEKEEHHPIPVTKHSNTAVPPAVYGQYQPGLSLQGWIFNKPDGGHWLRLERMQTSLEDMPDTGMFKMPVEIPLPSSDEPLPDIVTCMDAPTYKQFVARGLYQFEQKLNGTKKHNCVPVNFVRRAEAIRMHGNRVKQADWKMKLTHEMRRLEILLRQSHSKSQKPVEVRQTKEVEVLSEKRNVLIRIVEDEELSDGDKKLAIENWLRSWDIQIRDGLYVADNNEFLLCQHSLDALEGKIDPLTSTKKDGQTLCKLCGQVLLYVDYDAEEEYDDSGFQIQSRAVLGEIVGKAAIPVDSLAVLLDASRRPDGATILSLIRMLGVEPEQGFLQTFIATAYPITDLTLKSIPDPMFRNMFGIAWFIVLLKTHTPALVPQRKYPKFFYSLAGFPRSMEEARMQTVDTNSPLIDYVLDVLSYNYRQISHVMASRERRDPLVSSLLDNRVKFRETVVTLIRRILSVMPRETQLITPEADTEAEQSSVLQSASNPPKSIEDAKTQEEVGLWLWHKLGRVGDLVVPTTLVNHYAEQVFLAKQTAQAMSEPMSVAFSPELVLEDPLPLDDKNIHQIHQHEIVAETPKSAKRKTQFGDLVFPKSEAELENAVRVRTAKLSKLPRISIPITRNDLGASEQSLVFTHIMTGCMQQLCRFFVGKLQNKYSTDLEKLEGGNKLAELVVKREKFMESIPTLHVENPPFKLLEDIYASAVEIPSWVDPNLRRSAVDLLFRDMVKILKDSFGVELATKALEFVMESEIQLWKNSPGTVQSKLEELRTTERKFVVTQLGLQADEDRVMTRELMDAGLLSSSTIVDMMDRRRFADFMDSKDDIAMTDGSIETIEEGETLINTNDDEALEVADGGYYGEYIDTDD